MKTALRSLALATVLIGLASTSAKAQYFPDSGGSCGPRGCWPSSGGYGLGNGGGYDGGRGGFGGRR